MGKEDLEAQVPNYDYRCRDCLNVWLENHSFKETAESLGLKCPECSSHDIHKYFGNMKTLTVKFKGAGFAVNDMALEKLGMPESIRNSPHTKKALEEL